MNTEDYIILLLLLVVIVLFKLLIRKNWSGKTRPDTKNNTLPDIVGEPRSIPGQLQPKQAANAAIEIHLEDQDNFETEIKEGQDLQQTVADDLLEEVSHWERQQEERYFNSNRESGFATGVTFEELSTVGLLLQQEVLAETEKDTAVDVVSKIHGTALFDLLEGSIGGATEKIVKLMDSVESRIGSEVSTMQEDNFNDFNIDQYV